jgi:CSLREA domain-containing protein
MLLVCALLPAAGASAQTTVSWSVTVPDRPVFFAGDPRESVFVFGACPVSVGCRAVLTPDVPARVVIASVGAEKLGLWSPFDREKYVFRLVFDTGVDRATLTQDAHFAFVGTGGPATAQWRFLAQTPGPTATVNLDAGRSLDVTLLPWGGDFTQVTQSADIAAEVVLRVPSTQPGTTIKVSTTADDAHGNGNCTLREAIIAANTDSAVDRCPAGSGADRIIVPAGTYVLSLAGPGDDSALTGDLDVASTVSIRGAGADTTIIDGGSFDWPDSDRVFQVLDGADLTLSRVTIRGGHCWNGGGIFNAGRLMVVDGRVRDNVTSENASDVCRTLGALGGGGGIHSLGVLTITRSAVSGNAAAVDTQDQSGGGVLNRGSATIEASEVKENFGAAGGGIMNYGDLEVTDTEIGHNSARFWGAGLTNRGHADLLRTTVSGNVDGGILNEGGALVLRNSTVSGNHSMRVAGSVIDWAGTAEIFSSTIADNTSSRAPNCDGPPCLPPVSGLSGRPRLTNTVVSNPGYGDCWDPIVSLGNNLDHDGSCGLDAPGDLPSTDPRLGPLADNGGVTPTHALLVGSPAIDHIPVSQCGSATDQRGVPRPQPNPKLSRCDIGAYEFSPAGDILLMIEDVLRLGAEKRMLQAQVDTLANGLKLVWRDAAAGQSGAACARLDDVTTTVVRFADEGHLDQAVGQSLLDDATRIRALLCP